MKGKKLLYFLFVIVLYSSCQRESRTVKEVKNMYGRKIEFVNGYELLSIDSSTLSKMDVMDKTIKIVSYLEDFYCTECTYKKLLSQIEAINNLGPEIGYIVIVHTEKKKDLLRNLRAQRISLPIMYYDTDTFKIHNKLEVLASNRTFLLNQNNEIVLVGEPFNNRKLFELYNKTIKDLANDGK